MNRCHFQRCVSHRFKLSVNDILSGEVEIVERARMIMKKLRNLIQAAKLDGHTHLKAKLDNVTRWSDILKMLKQYQQLLQLPLVLDVDFIDENLLKPSENKQVNNLCDTLGKLDSATKAL